MKSKNKTAWYEKKIVKFFLVGAIAVVVDFVFLNASHLIFQIPLYWAVAVGYLAGFSTSYLLNARHTFAAGYNLVNLYRFIFINIVGLIMTNLIIAAFIRVDVHYNLAKLVAVEIVFFFNYITYKKWVFATLKKKK